MTITEDSEPAERVSDVMERFHRHWVEQGAPIVERLQPGLTAEAIDALMAPTGLTLPSEVRALFMWRNGAAGPDVDYEVREVGVGWSFLPLEELIDWSRDSWNTWREEMAPELDYESVDAFFPHLFPVFGGFSSDEHLMINCGNRPEGYPNAVTHVYRIDGPTASPSVQSLLVLLETWALWLDAGLVRWDAASGQWQRDDDALDWTTYRAAFC